MLKEIKILKKQQQKIGNFLKFLPCEPNHLTLLSLLISILAVYFIFIKDMTGGLLVLVTFFLDALDGAVARAKKQTTPFGAYLDGMTDRIVEFFILFPFLIFDWSRIQAIIILFFGTCMHSFSKAYADHRKILKTEQVLEIKSFFGREERGLFIIFAIFLYLLNFFEYSYYLFWISAILSVIGFLFLEYKIYKKIKEKI